MAANRIGGPRKLRDHLRARSADIASWLAGLEEPPSPVFLQALELILDQLDNRGRLPGKSARE